MGMMGRSTRRVRTCCRLAYVGMIHDLEGEAQTIDLSISGCRATCLTPPAIGTKLQVSVDLPGLTHPLPIELAVVRWVRQTMMGIEFCSVPSPHLKRLLAWIVTAPYWNASLTSTEKHHV
jgi:PilZ domain